MVGSLKGLLLISLKIRFSRFALVPKPDSVTPFIM